ncbi:hypothetical protein [Roseomonas sp. USHLN139]|uniref:hypothetical protein n=1 Tax=Roseomonas sp. USHLN139 TaxID=3081298 RepID=UPI003B01FA60
MTPPVELTGQQEGHRAGLPLFTATARAVDLEEQRREAGAHLRHRLQRGQSLAPLLLAPGWQVPPGTPARDLLDAFVFMPVRPISKPIVDDGAATEEESAPEPRKLRHYRKRIAPTERHRASFVRGACVHVQGSCFGTRPKTHAPDLRRVFEPPDRARPRNCTLPGNANRKDPTMSNGDSGNAPARPQPCRLTACLAASPVYHPSYFNRAVAYVKAGARPPLPLRSDLAALVLPTLAMLFGLAIGGAL